MAKLRVTESLLGVIDACLGDVFEVGDFFTLGEFGLEFCFCRLYSTGDVVYERVEARDKVGDGRKKGLVNASGLRR